MFLTLIMFLEESKRLFCLISLKVAYTISGYLNSVSPKSIDETGNRYTAVSTHSPPLPAPHAMLHMQISHPQKLKHCAINFDAKKLNEKYRNFC